jgi:hypothetical protein
MSDNPPNSSSDPQDQQDLIRRLLINVPVTKAPTDSPEERRNRAAAENAELDVTLKKRVANYALAFMGIQILVADLVFVMYGSWNGWHIPSRAILGWLGAAVIEVIGVVYVITSYLFPKRQKRK